MRLLQWTAIALGGLGALILLGIATQRWVLAYTNYGPAVVWRWSLPWFAGAIGLAPAPVLGLISLWRTRNTGVAIYPSGVVYRQGRRHHSLPWQEIVSLRTVGPWMGLPGLRRIRPTAVIIEATEGRRLRLTRDLIGFSELVDELKRKVYPRLHRIMAGEFNRGHPLYFGPISLWPQYLQWGRRQIPYDAIVAITLSEGALNLTIRDSAKLRKASIPVSIIPNAELCLEMVESLGLRS
jgi:hypothetical protein